jgi:mono/diheme cytochrome c family protein
MTVFALAASLLAYPCARAATGAENWTHHCASCHGEDGVGKTKMGRKVNAKDLTSAEYQKSFTDEQLLEHLKSGENGPDGKVKMKAYADTLSADEMKGLVSFVRALVK